MIDKEKLERMKKLADGMYYAAQYLTTDASRLHKAMEDYHQFIITEYNKQEPASEDFESEWKRYCDSKGGGVVTMNVKHVAKHFVEWQKEQFEKNRLASCDAQTEEEAEVESDFVMGIIGNEHRHPTFDDAIKYGMRLQKEQMMKGAIETTIDGKVVKVIVIDK